MSSDPQRPSGVHRPTVGDVFTVPFGDDRVGVGQIVGVYGDNAYYFAIFDVALPVTEARERAIEAISTPLLFLALSLDAKLHAGQWLVVGRASVSADIP